MIVQLMTEIKAQTNVHKMRLRYGHKGWLLEQAETFQT